MKFNIAIFDRYRGPQPALIFVLMVVMFASGEGLFRVYPPVKGVKAKPPE